MIRIIKILNELSFYVIFRKERRIDSFKFCDLPDNVFSFHTLQLFQHIQDFQEFYISLANNNKVEKLLKWDRIEHGWPAPHDNRPFFSVFRSYGDSGKVKHIKDIGDIEFIRKGKADHIHGRKWRPRFKRCKRETILF